MIRETPTPADVVTVPRPGGPVSPPGFGPGRSVAILESKQELFVGRTVPGRSVVSRRGVVGSGL